jgi:hypothetical protein
MSRRNATLNVLFVIRKDFVMPFDKFNPTIDPAKLRKDAQKLTILASPITDAAKAYVEADIHVTPGDNSYALLEQKGAFARVGVAASEGGGYALILKHVYDTWVVVAAGQDKPGKDIGQKYGLPAEWFSTEY